MRPRPAYDMGTQMERKMDLGQTNPHVPCEHPKLANLVKPAFTHFLNYEI